MGLDVQLYRIKNARQAQQQEEEFQKILDAEVAKTGKDWDDLSDKRQDAIRKKMKPVAERLGLDEDGWAPGSKITRRPKKNDIHSYLVGQFRSDYNHYGLNNVLSLYGVPTLFAIFQYEEEMDDRIHMPNWNDALKRVREALEAYQNAFNGESFLFDVEEIPIFERKDGLPSDKGEALDFFMKQLARSKTERDRLLAHVPFQYGGGHFNFKGQKVYAFIRGYNEVFESRSNTGRSIFVIVDKSRPKSIEYDSYYQALKGVEKTIEHVLAQRHPEEHILRWNG